MSRNDHQHAFAQTEPMDDRRPLWKRANRDFWIFMAVAIAVLVQAPLWACILGD